MSDDFTAVDSLLLDVERVERTVSYVVQDGEVAGDDSRLLVSLVCRLRQSADVLADCVYRWSVPVSGVDVRACVRPRRSPRGHAPEGCRVQRQGRDSGGRPKGEPSGPERSVPVAAASTFIGNPRGASLPRMGGQNANSVGVLDTTSAK